MTPHRFVARYGFGLAILALASGMVVGFSQTVEGEKSADGANMPPPPEVSVAQVVSRDVRQWDEFTGRVRGGDPRPHVPVRWRARDGEVPGVAGGPRYGAPHAAGI